MSNNEYNCQLGDEWEKLNPKLREPFEKLAELDKERYHKVLFICFFIYTEVQKLQMQDFNDGFSNY